MSSLYNDSLLVNFNEEERAKLRGLRDRVRAALGNGKASETSINRALVDLADPDDVKLVKRLIEMHRRTG